MEAAKNSHNILADKLHQEERDHANLKQEYEDLVQDHEDHKQESELAENELKQKESELINELNKYKETADSKIFYNEKKSKI